MILNLTQHPATPEQIADGVLDFEPEARAMLAEILTFESLPTVAEIEERAEILAGRVVNVPFDDIAPHGLRVMIGGAPFLMAPLETALRRHGYQPVYAFSARESVEQIQPDGSVRKSNVFRHIGFVDCN